MHPIFMNYFTIRFTINFMFVLELYFLHHNLQMLNHKAQRQFNF